MGGLIVEHVLTRSVRDSAAVLDATAGYVPGDPYTAPPPQRPFREEVGSNPGRLRIACLTATMREDVTLHPDCRKAVDQGLALLTSLGHVTEEVIPAISAEFIARAFTTIWAAGCAFNVKLISFMTGKDPAPDQYEPLTWALYEMGTKVTGGDYLMANQVLQRMTRDLASFFSTYDVVLTPTLGSPPIPLGTLVSTPEDPMAAWRKSAEFVPFTPICNATGQPAMSIPLFWNDEGLPIGLHFIGRYGDEAYPLPTGGTARGGSTLGRPSPPARPITS